MNGDNHEMTELELYRKEIVNKTDTIELLKRDIAEMQSQVQNGLSRTGLILVLRKKVEALPSVVGQNKRKMPKENILSVCHELKL